MVGKGTVELPQYIMHNGRLVDFEKEPLQKLQQKKNSSRQL